MELLTPIYTIGYGNRTVEEMITLLQQYGIQYLLDVRSSPYSRFKPEFGKEQLENALRPHHIRYVFLGQALGGRPADPDCYVDGKVDYDRVREKPFYQAGIERVRTAWAKKLPVVLMCSELRPQECHRAKLISETLDGLGIPVQHIDENGNIKPHAEIINDLTSGQLTLFGSQMFTSRKRYDPGVKD
ncbi:MAG: DUF488 domain-containing protein [Anaerolineae bacterium]|nr:DUF488 domain-containing protein [Anaerolineae bacterium]